MCCIARSPRPTDPNSLPARSAAAAALSFLLAGTDAGQSASTDEAAAFTNWTEYRIGSMPKPWLQET